MCSKCYRKPITYQVRAPGHCDQNHRHSVPVSPKFEQEVGVKNGALAYVQELAESQNLLRFVSYGVISRATCPVLTIRGAAQ